MQPATAVFSVVATMVLAHGVPGVAHAQAEPASLEVRVVDESGSPVSGATVEATSQATGSSSTLRTDADGHALFTEIAPGTYSVVVSTPGRREAAEPVEVVAGQRSSLNIATRFAIAAEVTVTATRGEVDRFVVPGEVEVVDRQKLDELQARSLEEALRYVPGVEIEAPRRLLQTPSIRGMSDVRVLVLKDGARVSQLTTEHKGSLFLETQDIERIEVVKGPASALYGSGALGGVISIQTRDPGDMLQGADTLGAVLSSNYSSAYGEVMMSPRVFGGSVDGPQFMVGYTGRRNDGEISVAGGLDRIDSAEEDVDNFDGRLIIPVGSTGRLRASGSSYDVSGRSALNLTSAPVAVGEQTVRRTRQRTLSLSYQEAADVWWREDLQANAFTSVLDLDETLQATGRVDEIDFRSWGFGVRNANRVGSSQRLTYGIEYFQDRESSIRDGGFNVLFPNGSQRQTGVYFQDEISLANDRLLIVPALRWDRWDSTTETTGIETRTESRLSPKVGATYRVVDDFVVSANYGEGFRAPNFQELFIGGPHFAVPLGGGFFLRAFFEPNPELRPETSRTVDVGLRLRQGPLSARVGFFRSWVDAFIAFEVTEGFRPPTTVLLTFMTENVQAATLYGYEASARWTVSGNVSLWANHSTTRGEDDATGEPLPSLPPSRTSVGVEARAPRAGLGFGLNARVAATQTRVPDDVEPTDGYTLLDAYGSWTPSALPRLTVFLGVNNLADTAYQVPFFTTPGTGRDVRFGVTVNVGR